ncbi:MAG: type II toxin-antitoxin system RelE/ParE family toxin [Bacteroidales bacterium]|nr:type II toxin-antitoxin system RelE/ParE family toxin [Bacteroidales bacterium]
MSLVVYWTTFAENKLTDIYHYYEIEAGIQVAQKLVDGIIDATIILENNPNIGQKEELLINKPQDFRYLVFKNYKIVYWINTTKNRIEIVHVFDCRQNPVKLKMTK